MDTQIQPDMTSAPGVVAEGTPPEAATPASSLLGEIARAMQAAAGRERERIEAGIGEDEAVQVEKIHTRAGAEAAALRKGADDDVVLVNGWCEEETRRIRDEADRRIADRRSRLEQSITQHGSLIEAEIESVHLAVGDYRDSLGAFFGRLADEPDPSTIARLAGTLPEPPDLDAARADARSRAMKALEAEAVAEPPVPIDDVDQDADGGSATGELVPVMDPNADAPPAWRGAGPSTARAHEAAAVAQPVNVRPTRTWWLGRSSR